MVGRQRSEGLWQLRKTWSLSALKRNTRPHCAKAESPRDLGFRGAMCWSKRNRTIDSDEAPHYTADSHRGAGCRAGGSRLSVLAASLDCLRPVLQRGFLLRAG